MQPEPNLSQMIAVQIRQLRRKKGLTVTELARRTGISKSMISQVENGGAVPSIETMRSIAAVLEVPLFTLFLNQDQANGALVRKEERITLMIPGSDATRELLTPNLQRAMALVIGRIPPGASSSPSPTTHRGEECVFVLQGQVIVHLQGEIYNLNIGDALYFDARLPHFFINPGDTEAEFLSAISAAQSESVDNLNVVTG